jgi:group I intron endonuclease
MKIYTIYKATNVMTDKVYIGFTSRTLKRRIAGHKRDAFSHGSENKFHTSIREFGWHSFIFEEIYQAKEDLPPKQSHTFKIMEDYFIQEHNSIIDGYNTCKGGGSYPIMSGSAHPLYGIGHSDDTRQLLRDNHHDVSGFNNPMYGRVGEDNPKSVKFKAVDPNGNVYVVRGINNFASQHNLTGSLIIQVLKKRRPHHKNWKFEYV